MPPVRYDLQLLNIRPPYSAVLRSSRCQTEPNVLPPRARPGYSTLTLRVAAPGRGTRQPRSPAHRAVSRRMGGPRASGAAKASAGPPIPACPAEPPDGPRPSHRPATAPHEVAVRAPGSRAAWRVWSVTGTIIAPVRMRVRPRPVTAPWWRTAHRSRWHAHGTPPSERKSPRPVSAGRGPFRAGGRYWVRTSDLFRVKEARYRCANRPRSWSPGPGLRGGDGI